MQKEEQGLTQDVDRPGQSCEEKPWSDPAEPQAPRREGCKCCKHHNPLTSDTGTESRSVLQGAASPPFGKHPRGAGLLFLSSDEHFMHFGVDAFWNHPWAVLVETKGFVP